jgi:Uncharacterized conserved protein (DUF2190)
MNNILLVNYTAEAAIAPFRIVKPGSAASEKTIVPAAAATDNLMGTIDQPSGAAVGERADVHRAGIPLVEAGAVFARDVPLTSDALGRAIQAAPAAGANVRIIGFADQAATAAGDVVRYVYAPGVMQG